MRRARPTLTLTITLTLAFALGSCKKEQPPAGGGTGAAAKEDPKSADPKAEPKAAKAGTCTAPTIESIAAGAIKGEASGKPFAVATV
jgi:hypothetical protein